VHQRVYILENFQRDTGDIPSVSRSKLLASVRCGMAVAPSASLAMSAVLSTVADAASVAVVCDDHPGINSDEPKKDDISLLGTDNLSRVYLRYRW
jgi:hypothetical protein